MGSQNKADKTNSKAAQSNSKANKQNSQKLGKSNTKAASQSAKKGNKMVGDIVAIIVLGGLFYFMYMIFAKAADNPALIKMAFAPEASAASAISSVLPMQTSQVAQATQVTQTPQFLQQLQGAYNGIANSAQSYIQPYIQNAFPVQSV